MQIQLINPQQFTQLWQAASRAKFDREKYTTEEYQIVIKLVTVLQKMNEGAIEKTPLNLKVDNTPQEKVQLVIGKILDQRQNYSSRSRNSSLTPPQNRETTEHRATFSSPTSTPNSQNPAPSKIPLLRKGSIIPPTHLNGLRNRGQTVYKKPEKCSCEGQEQKEELQKHPHKMLHARSAPLAFRRKKTALPQFLVDPKAYEELCKVAIHLKYIKKQSDIADADLELFLREWEERVLYGRFFWPDYLTSSITVIGERLEKEKSKLPKLPHLPGKKTSGSPEERTILEIGKIGLEYRQQSFEALFFKEEQAALYRLIDIVRLLNLTHWTLGEIKQRFPLQTDMFLSLQKKINFLEQFKTPQSLIRICEPAAAIKYFPELQESDQPSSQTREDIDLFLTFYDAIVLTGKTSRFITQFLTQQCRNPEIRLASLMNTAQFIMQLEPPPLVRGYEESDLSATIINELNSFETFEQLAKEIINQRTNYSALFGKKYNAAERDVGVIITDMYRLMKLCYVPFPNALERCIAPLFKNKRLALTNLVKKAIVQPNILYLEDK